MNPRRQSGAMGALLVVVLVIMLAIALAGYVLRRISDSSEDASRTTTRLATAADAVEAFAASRRRLPCPAQPDADTGLEVQPAVPSPSCSFPRGTVPWQTIGLKREDALDAWGRKISYRVYTGASGSLVQPNGVSMVECDTVEPPPLKGVAAGGLCRANADVTLRNTTPDEFLLGKGLRLTDMALPQFIDVAYVLVSHGATGLGGYTISGARLPLPAGAELRNTRNTGAFTIKAASDPDMAATSGSHFDDLLAYRRLPDLIRRIRLEGRDWLDVGTTSVVFNAPTVSAAIGSPVSPGGTGRTTISFSGAQVSGLAGTSTATEITYGTTTSGGVGGLGIAGGGSNLIQSSANEFLRIDFANGARRFGATLGEFGVYGTDLERVEFRFYLGETQVGSGVGIGCNVDGGLASFTVSVDQLFNRVEIAAIPTANVPPGISAFLVSEVKACDTTASECRTSLDTSGNRCT